MDCYSIVYVSETTVSLSEATLLTLLRQARAEHEAAGLTGFLLYGDGCFMQVIEGAAASVRELFGRIARDPRHSKLDVLADGPRPGRDFTAWHMCFEAGFATARPLPNLCCLNQLRAVAAPTSVYPLLLEFLARCAGPLPWRVAGR